MLPDGFHYVLSCKELLSHVRNGGLSLGGVTVSQLFSFILRCETLHCSEPWWTNASLCVTPKSEINLGLPMKKCHTYGWSIEGGIFSRRVWNAAVPCRIRRQIWVILEADAGIWSEFTDSGSFVVTKGVRLRHRSRDEPWTHVGSILGPMDVW